MAGKKWRQQHRKRHEGRNEGVKIMNFQVQSTISAARAGAIENLMQYSTRSCWQSYVNRKEELILALETKALLSEIRILNKNACTVSVSVAVENRQRSYIDVMRLENLPHHREVCVMLPFYPCKYLRLQFERRALPDISVYAVQPFGIPSDDLEVEYGPALCSLLCDKPEHLLFGSSLRASQSFMDCLSDHRLGSPEWMASRRGYLLDQRIARLEAALFNQKITKLQ